jgi:hypothetical protein
LRPRLGAPVASVRIKRLEMAAPIEARAMMASAIGAA